jgi:hypothetical protein
MESERTYTAFAGHRCVATGDVRAMLQKTKEHIDSGGPEPVLVFEDQTGSQIDFDLRGTTEEVLARLAAHPHFAAAEAQKQAQRGPGRPKLGVVSREVSLLPRHWEWLEAQPEGVSAALRRIVEEAKKRGQGKHLGRAARDAAGKFMWAMGGNLPGFEEASRALFAKDQAKLEHFIRDWPEDVRKHVGRLVAEAARLEKEGSAPE